MSRLAPPPDALGPVNISICPFVTCPPPHHIRQRNPREEGKMANLLSTPNANANKENAPRGKFPTPHSVDRLSRPFKCPGSATRAAATDRPARKKRRVDYKGADDAADDDKPWTNTDRL